MKRVRHIRMKCYGTSLKHPYTGYYALTTGDIVDPGEERNVGRTKARREAKHIIAEQLADDKMIDEEQE